MILEFIALRPSRRIALFIAAHWALVMGAAIILHRRDGDHWLVSLTGVGAISLAFLAIMLAWRVRARRQRSDC